MPSSIVPNLKCRMCLKMNPPGSRFCNYCGNDLTFSIQPDGLLPPGAVLRGSYVIEDVIGEGGMGVVYRCHHKSLGTRYALKVLDPKLARMDVLRRRFLAEARIQAEVVHPHIVHVMDVIDSDKDGGIPGILAIVMEYVDGDALDRILERSTLSVFDAVSSTLVILDAIGFAHHKGIIHRDLKPSNIMVSRAESREMLYRGVKVMDFGIAKLLREDEQRTVTGAKMGTPRYMAPEQIENARDVDERTDLYAIGLTLYELLCGRTPFESYKEFELLKAQMSMKPPSMRTYRGDIPDRLEAIVMKSLEKDRANRYPNAESFQRALLSLGGYDEIALRLNPQDGAYVSSSNQKLQRKIERAIDRNKPKEGAERARGVSGRKKASARSLQTASSLESGGRTDSLGMKKNLSGDALALGLAPTEIKPERAGVALEGGRAKKSGHSTHSTVKVPKERLSSTSQRALARAKSAEIVARAATRAPQTEKRAEKKMGGAVLTNSPRQVAGQSTGAVLRERMASQVVHDIRENADLNKSNSANSSQKQLNSVFVKDGALKNGHEVGIRAAGTLGQDGGVLASGAMLSLADSELQDDAQAALTEPRKGASVVKIVFFVMLMLACAGLIYRYTHEMPASSPRSEVMAPEHAVQALPSLVEDVSRVPLEERQTTTGRMTVIPKAEHWISTGKRGEIARRILDGFAIDQVEVSYYQYMKCVEASACPPLGAMPPDLSLPVTHVGYGTAEAFCKFAGKMLPTAEQWEAAARFGGDTDGITHVNVSCETVHCGSGVGGECRKVNPAQPESVFKRVPGANPGHILNMLGNVREWTRDVGQDKQTRVTKGGSYLTPKKSIQISGGEEVRANEGAADLGFRCVSSL